MRTPARGPIAEALERKWLDIDDSTEAHVGFETRVTISRSGGLHSQCPTIDSIYLQTLGTPIMSPTVAEATAERDEDAAPYPRHGWLVPHVVVSAEGSPVAQPS